MKIPLDLIAPNWKQPRKDIASAEIETLAASLLKEGLLNPIAVEPADENGIFYLLDGERRWRAAIMAGWSEIESNVREGGAVETDADRLLLALIGNLQRADMRPVDEAMAFNQLVDAGMTQDEIATRIGKSASFVSGRLKLLDFSPMIQSFFNTGALPFDNRFLLALRNLNEDVRETVATLCAELGYSARQAVSLCRRTGRRTPFSIDNIPGRVKRSAVTKPSIRNQESQTLSLAALPDSDCLPLLLHPLTAKDAYLSDAIKQTCLDCGMYEKGGVRTICPPCPLVTYARIVAKGRA